MQTDEPACPRREHAGSRVTRNGSYGPYGRQRYKCYPGGAPPHTFSLLVEVPDPEADAPPTRLKSFRHSVADIAHALVCIGRGASYRQAAIQVGGRSLGPGGINGQLVANWVSTFTPVVVAEPETRWPDLVAVGAFLLRRGSSRDDLVVQLATAPGVSGPRLLHVQVAGQAARGAWSTFYARYAGRPAVLVVEPDRPAAVAAQRRWADNPPTVIAPPRRTGTASGADVQAHGGPDTATQVDAALAQLHRSRELLFRRFASRQSHFTNLGQLNQLAALMRLDVNGTADQATYVDRILAGRPRG